MTFQTVKVKLSLCKPREDMRAPESWSSQNFWKSSHKSGKVVIPTHLPSSPSRENPWYSFLLEADSTSGTQCDHSDLVNEKVPTGNQNRGLQDFSATPAGKYSMRVRGRIHTHKHTLAYIVSHECYKSSPVHSDRFNQLTI